MSRIIDVRDEVYLRIASRKALDKFVFNNFTLETTYIPFERLESFSTNHPNGKVYVIGLNSGDLQTVSRSNTTLVETPVQVGFQYQIEPDESDVGFGGTNIEDLFTLVEELAETARSYFALDSHSFSRLEYLKDENGTPFSFLTFRNIGMFEAYFTAYYLTTLA